MLYVIHDDKGFGPSLVRNGVTRARMFQEITIAAQTDCSDDAALAAAFEQLEATLNSPLGNMKVTMLLVNIHWLTVHGLIICQVATNMGKGSAVSSRAKVNSWFAAVQSHPSTSKEAINPFGY